MPNHIVGPVGPLAPQVPKSRSKRTSTVIVARVQRCAAFAGCCAAMALIGATAHLGLGSYASAPGMPLGQAVAVTTPSETPAVTKAEPTITGPAPLYAGEAPDSNPQAQIP